MPKHSITFEAIGTQWVIETVRLLPDEVTDQIHARIESFDKTYSRFRKDSLVTTISKQPGIYTFPDDAVLLFDFYDALYEVTDAKVTPLIGGMLEKAGYDADYTFHQHTQVALPAWGDVVERRNTILKVKHPVMLDVGAAGKGYLVDCVCELLDAAGVEDYVVDASGDLRHKGVLENAVGLEDPRDPSKVIGVIDIMNKSLCASATNRRTWGSNQHHIFDPDAMEPVKDVISTWVIADSTMIADGIATALFFTDPQVLSDRFQYEYVRMYANGAIDYSPMFEGRLF